MQRICNLLLLCLITTGALNAQQPPNIIYIYADDLGYGELGCYGQEHIRTPNIDRMAAEGLRFTRHYAAAPVCAPSRAALMTGRHTGQGYIRGNYELGGFEDDKEGGQMPLPEGTYTIGHMLQQAGYVTGLFGKWGLGMANTTGSPRKQGFHSYISILDQKQAHNFYPTHLWANDEAVPIANTYTYVHQAIDSATATQADFDRYKGLDYAQDFFTNGALHMMDSIGGKKPFFIYLPYTSPHLSLQVPDAWVKTYAGQFTETPYYGQYGYAPHPFPKSAYAGMISYLDAQVGIILKALQDKGLDKNTLVIFSSDNGATFHKSVDTEFFNSNGGLRGYKMDVYEGGIRVPMIARWPGTIAAGGTTPHVSAQYDVLATLADLLRMKPPVNDGISFLPTLLGTRQAQHPYLYFEYPENGGQVAIIAGSWKGVRTGVKANKKAPWQIYHLDKDPLEKQDVAALYPAIVAQMERIQQEAHRPAHIREWEFIDPKF